MLHVTAAARDACFAESETARAGKRAKKAKASGKAEEKATGSGSSSSKYGKGGKQQTASLRKKSSKKAEKKQELPIPPPSFADDDLSHVNYDLFKDPYEPKDVLIKSLLSQRCSPDCTQFLCVGCSGLGRAFPLIFGCCSTRAPCPRCFGYRVAVDWRLRDLGIEGLAWDLAQALWGVGGERDDGKWSKEAQALDDHLRDHGNGGLSEAAKRIVEEAIELPASEAHPHAGLAKLVKKVNAARKKDPKAFF